MRKEKVEEPFRFYRPEGWDHRAMDFVANHIKPIFWLLIVPYVAFVFYLITFGANR